MYTLNINGNVVICFYDNGKGEVYQAEVKISDYSSQSEAIAAAQKIALENASNTSS